MDSSKHFSSFTCDIKIKEAKNIESKLKGNIFVRCYLPSGLEDQKAVILNSRSISTKDDKVWNESFSLECRETKSSGGIIDKLVKRQKLIFELRLKNKIVSIFGGSKLLGRREVPLEEILNSPNSSFDEWITMGLTRGHEDERCPKLKVEVKAKIVRNVIRNNVRKNWDMCGCKNGVDHDHHGCTCDDYDVFALVLGLETF